MRKLLLACLFATFPLVAHAIEAPADQVPLETGKVLHGHFTEEHQVNGNPLETSGHFVAAPSHGLIWGIEKPFPTSTIITPNNVVQDIGGLGMKLPAKNIRHLYEVIGSALAGNWSGLETDFVITTSHKGKNWQMLLTPREGSRAKLPYARITVSGSRFVENIVMSKNDGTSDALSFTDASLSPEPLSAQEVALFKEAGQ